VIVRNSFFSLTSEYSVTTTKTSMETKQKITHSNPNLNLIGNDCLLNYTNTQKLLFREFQGFHRVSPAVFKIVSGMNEI
jgi:hypothetical protein